MRPEDAEKFKANYLLKMDSLTKDGLEILGMEFKVTDELRAVLLNPAMVTAMAVLQMDCNAVAPALISVDLGSAGGTYKAARLQGRAEGIQHAISTLLHLATQEESNADTE